MSAPEWIAYPYYKGWAKSFNQALQLDYPPGTTRFTISPTLKDQYWLVYRWHYPWQGPRPAGYTANFVFQWIQGGIELFSDPMIRSVVQFPYPVFLIVTRGDPVDTIAINNTGATQTVDFIAFLGLFKGKNEFEKWETWFEKRYGTTLEELRKELIEMRRGKIRRV